MKPEWAWHGDSEHEGGLATYTVGGSGVANVPLPNFRTAASLADMMYHAYRDGLRDGIRHTRDRVDQATRDLTENDL